jgi:L-alanine-DL-glutamate epimerase-like enolase superfamily enzyme
MRITNVSTAVLESNFDWTLVKVETAEGIVGFGEAFVGPGVAAVIREFKTVLAGEDPTSLDRILRRMKASASYASPGVVFHAINGIESALIDLIGKRYRLPAWQILGGKYRDEVKIYADCHAGEALESIGPLLTPRTPQWMRPPGEPEERKSQVSLKHHGWDASGGDYLKPEAYAHRAQEMAARGFRILKFDVDVPTPFETDEYNRDLTRPEIEYMAALVQATRAAIGPDVGLAIDCHWNYGVQAAIELARAFESCHLLWLEDPVPPENIPAIGVVQANTALPIATGENHFFRLDFLRLITEARLRVLAPDVQKVGLWEGRKIADLADLHYVNLTWHNISGPLGTMAGVHLSAAVPNVVALEWHAASVPFFDKLVKNPGGPMIRDGRIRVPDTPGLGIELDLDECYRYRKPGEPFFE